MDDVYQATVSPGLAPPRDRKGAWIKLLHTAEPVELCISYVHKGYCVRQSKGLHCWRVHPEYAQLPVCDAFTFTGSCSQGELCVGQHKQRRLQCVHLPHLMVQCAVSVGLRVSQRICELLGFSYTLHTGWPIVGCTRRSGSKHSDMLIGVQFPEQMPEHDAVATICNDAHLAAAMLRVYRVQHTADTVETGITEALQYLQQQESPASSCTGNQLKVKVRGWPSWVEQRAVRTVKQFEERQHSGRVLESDACTFVVDVLSLFSDTLTVGVSALSQTTLARNACNNIHDYCVPSSFLLRASTSMQQARSCKAQCKLEEAIDRLQIPIKGNNVCDIGAAPGSWSKVAAWNRAQRVIAIDPAELSLLDSGAESDPCGVVEHIQRKVEDDGVVDEVVSKLGGSGQVDLMLCDANLPSVSELMRHVKPLMREGGNVIVTVKDFHFSTWSAAASAQAEAERLANLFKGGAWRSPEVLHLLANSQQERTVCIMGQ